MGGRILFVGVGSPVLGGKGKQKENRNLALFFGGPLTREDTHMAICLFQRGPPLKGLVDMHLHLL